MLLNMAIVVFNENLQWCVCLCIQAGIRAIRKDCESVLKVFQFELLDYFVFHWGFLLLKYLSAPVRGVYIVLITCAPALLIKYFYPP